MSFRGRAVCVDSKGTAAVDEVETGEVPPGSVCVRLGVAALCGSDLHGIDFGYPDHGRSGEPGAPGHEGVGTVVLSKAKNREIGSRVLVVPPRAYARCFADFIVLPANYTVPLPSFGLSRYMVLAQQLGTVIYALKKFEIPGNSRVGVIGAGAAGAQFCRILHERGNEVVAFDLDAGRLDFVEWWAGVKAEQVTERGDEGGGGGGKGLSFDYVVEASGTPGGREFSLDLVKVEGWICCFGLPVDKSERPWTYQSVFDRRVSVVVSDSAQSEPGLVSFIEAAGQVAYDVGRFSDLVSHVVDLGDFTKALEVFRRSPGRRKVVLQCDED